MKTKLSCGISLKKCKWKMWNEAFVIHCCWHLLLLTFIALTFSTLDIHCSNIQYCWHSVLWNSLLLTFMALDSYCSDIHCRDIHCRDIHCSDIHCRDIHCSGIHCRDIHPLQWHPWQLHQKIRNTEVWTSKLPWPAPSLALGGVLCRGFSEVSNRFLTGFWIGF